MLKALIGALALGMTATFTLAGIAHAQVNCPPPGTSTKGCPYTPTAPQLPPRR